MLVGAIPVYTCSDRGLVFDNHDFHGNSIAIPKTMKTGKFNGTATAQ
jgi:hypothetical protein